MVDGYKMSLSMIVAQWLPLIYSLRLCISTNKGAIRYPKTVRFILSLSSHSCSHTNLSVRKFASTLHCNQRKTNLADVVFLIISNHVPFLSLVDLIAFFTICEHEHIKSLGILHIYDAFNLYSLNY